MDRRLTALEKRFASIRLPGIGKERGSNGTICRDPDKLRMYRRGVEEVESMVALAEQLTLEIRRLEVEPDEST